MQLHEWAQQPDAFRDDSWEENFLNALVQGNLKIENDQPQAGPDGWPYILVKTDPNAEEPSRNIIHWLSENGVGLVVNPHKEIPDYVFSYGMIWNFRQNGHFLSPPKEPTESGEVEFKPGQEVLAGNASEAYLPAFVRTILKRFLTDQGIKAPKILVMSADSKNFDLVFSLDSLGNPPKEEHQGIMAALSWFLPLNYSLVLAPEKGLPEFFDL